MIGISELPEASPDDIRFWLSCVSGLSGLEGFSGTGFDAKGRPIPYGTGPHSLPTMRRAVLETLPKEILEIGFGLGYGSAVLLALAPEARLTSIDPSDREETEASARTLAVRNEGRFRFHRLPGSAASGVLGDRRYDLAFIDGDHTEGGVGTDIALCFELDVPWLLFDDWEPRYGPGVQTAVWKAAARLKVIWAEGNQALARSGIPMSPPPPQVKQRKAVRGFTFRSRRALR